jgi:hypothetical protein
MTGSEENTSLIDFVMSADLHFLQERTLGLDLYHSGFAGLAVFCLAIASATVFLLAMFHVIGSRKHTTMILLGLGVLTFAIGVSGTYLNYASLPDAEATLIQDSAGPLPSVPAQAAAVVTLPLLCGAITLCFNALAFLYLAVFWSAGVRPDEPRTRKKKKKKKKNRR